MLLSPAQLGVGGGGGAAHGKQRLGRKGAVQENRFNVVTNQRYQKRLYNAR